MYIKWVTVSANTLIKCSLMGIIVFVSFNCLAFYIPENYVSYIYAFGRCYCYPLHCTDPHSSLVTTNSFDDHQFIAIRSTSQFFHPLEFDSRIYTYMKSHLHCLWYLSDREPLGTGEREINGFGWWSLTLLLSALLLHPCAHTTSPVSPTSSARLVYLTQPAFCDARAPFFPSHLCISSHALRRTFPTPPPYETGTCRRYLKTVCVVEKSAALW